VNRDYLQIGEVAQLTGLSLNTIRRYEHLGLIASTPRSKGGFRLYTDAEVQRLRALLDMRPLEFSVQEKRGLFEVLDMLAAGEDSALQREVLLDRLAMFGEAADQRVAALRDQLEGAEVFAAKLKSCLSRDRTGTPSASDSDSVFW
jgi:DNA-binding transcriptional MerR regulator